MNYMIERLGDISGKTFHDNLNDAFSQLEKEYPSIEDTRLFKDIDMLVKKGRTKEVIDYFCNIEDAWDNRARQTPDPEDDRILIWEINEDGSSRVVWHFSGWHWDFEAGDVVKGGLPQGRLPGDKEPLYAIAIED